MTGEPAAQRRPTTCHWWEDEYGGRYLIPGCYARVENPDLEACHCPSLEQQLEAARREIAALEGKRDALQTWHDHIVRAVYDHPDGNKIMKIAADRAEVASRRELRDG